MSLRPRKGFVAMSILGVHPPMYLSLGNSPVACHDHFLNSAGDMSKIKLQGHGTLLFLGV